MIQTGLCHHLAVRFEDTQQTWMYAEAVQVCKLLGVVRVHFLRDESTRSLSEAASEYI